MGRYAIPTLAPVKYPILTPCEYLNLARRAGISKVKASFISGVPDGTWEDVDWEERKICRAKLERLYRIAVDHAFSPPYFEKLSHKEYLALAENGGVAKKQARELSGFCRGSWAAWLYQGKSAAPYRQERLHRIAVTQGWL